MRWFAYINITGILESKRLRENDYYSDGFWTIYSTLAPLQRVKNAAAWLVLNKELKINLCLTLTSGRTSLQHYCSCCTGCPSSTASSSRSRHWCTTYTRSMLTCLHSTRQADSQRRQLRSSQTRAAVVKRTRTQFGKRAFSAYGSNIWKSLPPAVRNTDPAFRQTLKSHLFYCAYIA